MTKTITVEDEIHLLVTEKQTELYRKIGRMIKLSEIAGKAINNGINTIDNEYEIEKATNLNKNTEEQLIECPT